MWAFSPVIYSKSNKLWYVRDITMKSLYVHLSVFGPRWWIVKPMEFITYRIAEYKNDLFLAMMGEDVTDLPEVMNPFFSQTSDGISRDDERANVWIRNAILEISFSSPLRWQRNE